MRPEPHWTAQDHATLARIKARYRRLETQGARDAASLERQLAFTRQLEAELEESTRRPQ